MDAHFPYIPPAPFDRLFPGKDPRLIQESLDAVYGRVVQGAPMPANVKQHAVSQYDGGIAYIDAQLGQLLTWMRQQQLYDNTLIVLASDHGEAFGEHGLVLHGNSTYQNLLHVGLLVKFPHNAHAGIVDDPVSLVDVTPTILGALGYAAPASVQGRNLLEPTANPARPIFSESFPCAVLHQTECRSGCLIRAIFSWPYKFITSSSGSTELYNLADDPDETRNEAGKNTSEARKLSAELSDWVNKAPARAKQQLKIDPEVLQRLKSLGYIR
jgi:arylsulfatase A-like enzyme